MGFYLNIAKYYLTSAVWAATGTPFRIASLFGAGRRKDAGMRKLAVLRTGAIGDIVMTTPFLRRLRELFPESEIVYYTFAPNKPLLESNPNVNRVETLVHARAGGSTPDEKRRFLETFRAEGFDAAFFLDFGGPWSHWPGWVAYVPTRVGFDDLGRGFLLTHRVRKGWNSPGHSVVWYLELLKFFGGGDTRMEVHPSAADERAADEFLRENGVGDGDFLVAVAPGGGENPGAVFHAKRWPAERFAEVVARVEAGWGARVVVIGGAGDAGAAAPVLAGGGRLNAVGRFSLMGTAALLARCRLFIGNDSGPLHIAAAAGTPTVGIFGPTRPERLAPLGENHAAVSAGAPCAPCYLEIIGAARDCRGHVCMEAVTVESVMAAAERMKRAGLK